jgi:hypothetical protein
MHNETIKILLEKIEIKKQIIKKSIYHAISQDDICFFSKWCSKHFNIDSEVLSECTSLAEIADGLNYNGLFIYSLKPDEENNIYETNDIWWENEEQRKYLFFADDSISWFCWNAEDRLFYILDKPSGEKMDNFVSFAEMMTVALETTLL